MTKEKEFVDFLKKEIDEYKEAYSWEVKDIREYADENLEYSRGANYDLMIDNADRDLQEQLKNLMFLAEDRGVNPETIREIFAPYGL